MKIGRQEAYRDMLTGLGGDEGNRTGQREEWDAMRTQKSPQLVPRELSSRHGPSEVSWHKGNG